jgi:hypothetical protein
MGSSVAVGLGYVELLGRCSFLFGERWSGRWNVACNEGALVCEDVLLSEQKY